MAAFLAEKRAAFFNVGDLVTFGKYQNKRARIVAFHDDGKGNPLVELEPIPKGRKKNKVIALFKIRHQVNIEKVAARVSLRFALRQEVGRLAADDMQAVLLKIRKGVMTPLESIGKLTKVLDYLGGWKIEPMVGLVFIGPSNHPRLFLSDSEDEVQAVIELARKLEVTSLPANPKVDGLYVMDIDTKRPNYGFGFRYKLWIGAAGFRLTAPNGKEFELLPDYAVWSQRMRKDDFREVPAIGPRNSKFLGVRKCFEWLEKETPFKKQVLDSLGMEAHEKAQPRTKENTGSCPCCFRNIKLKKTSGGQLPLMVNHGYTRPGWGRQEGNCIGVGFPPFELSAAGTKHLVGVLKKQREDVVSFLKQLVAGQIKHLAFGRLTVTPESEDWPKAVIRAKASSEKQIEWLDDDVKNLGKLIADWKEEPLPEAGVFAKKWQLKDRNE